MRRFIPVVSMLFVLGLEGAAVATTAHVFYADTDADGYGDPGATTVAVVAPPGFTRTNGDCDDADPAVHPGAVEVCNAIDDDCDRRIDDRDPSLVGRPYYADADGDRYGSGPAAGWCRPPSGWVTADGDCDPSDRSVHPGAVEDCDGVDNDCDRLVDDEDPDVDGNHRTYADADGDGHGDTSVEKDSCLVQPGYVSTSDDCDDGDAAVYAGAPEYCDALDNDCDGSVDDAVVYVDWYVDRDGDGYGVRMGSVNDCVQATGYALLPGDCDDRVATTNPGASDECGDGVDDDCNGSVDDCQVSASDALVEVRNYSYDEFTTFAEHGAVGDLDADGTADVVMGNYPGPDEIGQVFVLRGPASGKLVLGDDMLRVSASGVGGYFGLEVAAGDLDADGFDDLVVGAPLDDDGKVFVFEGPLRRDLRADRADTVMASLVGSTTRAGAELDVGSDLDGDGLPDLVIGAYRSGSYGSVYVASGTLSGAVALDSDATYRFDGVFGSVVGVETADLGDTNGDGISDLAISDQDHDGFVYVVEGGIAAGTYDVDAAALATLSATTDVYFGWAVSSGDYDGDGLGDLLVSAPGQTSSTGDRSAGAVYGFLAPFSGALDEGSASVTWETSSRSGLGDGTTGVATGDVDGDGQVDVLIAAPREDTYAGAVYVQVGGASGTVDVATLPALRSVADDDQLGSFVAAMPDWTGDGGDEIVAAAFTANDPYGFNAGCFYVFASEDLY